MAFLQFLCDPDTKVALDGLFAETAKSFADPAADEGIPIAACVVQKIANPTGTRIYQPLDPAGGTFRAALGLVSQPAIAGTFFVGFGAKTSGTITSGKRYQITIFAAGDDFTNVGAGENATGVLFVASGTTPTTWTHASTLTEITTDLAFDIGTTALQAALNAMASITAAGGITVSITSLNFLITFLVAGVRALLSAGTAGLAPAGCVAEIGHEVTGTSTIAEIQFFRIVQSPAAFVDLTTAAPGPAGAVTPLATGAAGPPAVNAKYQVDLFTSDLNHAYDGRWSVTIGGVESALMSWDAAGNPSDGGTSGTDAQTTLEAMSSIGAGNVSVSRITVGSYIIGFQGAKAGTNMGTMTLDCSALQTVPFMTGTLLLSNPAVQLLFNGQPSVSVFCVIENTPSGGSRREISRRPATLQQPLIAQGALTPTPVFSFYTTDQTYSKAEIDAFFAGLVFGTMAAQNANAVAITGGTEDSVTYTNGLYNGVAVLSTGGIISLVSGATGIVAEAGSDIFVAANSQLAVSAAGKGVDFQNSLTFTGTDGSTLNVGGGGTLGSAAFTAAAAYVAAGAVVSSGLTQTTARLLGRTTASTGAIEQIAVGAGLTFTAGNLAVTNPYDPSAVAITGGSIGGASIVATTLGASGLSSLLGGLKLTYAQKTSTYTFLGSDYAIEATSGTFALNLLTAVGRIGQPFLAINSGSGVITLSTTGGQTINGLSTIAIPQGASFEVTSTGANWVITGEYGAAATGSFTTLTASGATTFTAGTGSSSVTTGTVVVTGGVGVSGTVWAGTLTTDGNINAAVAGKGLAVKGGTGGRIGTITLVGGTSGAISIPSITTSSRPQLQRVTAGGTLGAGGYDYTIAAGTSLTINSVDLTGVLSALDTSTISYFIPEQT